jgi:hypothetical protein
VGSQLSLEQRAAKTPKCVLVSGVPSGHSHVTAPTTLLTAMSHTPSSIDPNSHFQSIFDGALRTYKNTTGKELPSHPLFRDLTACDSPDAICQVLQRQLPGHDQPGTSRDTSTDWLVATVDVISQVVQTIGAGVSMVSRSCKQQARVRTLIFNL